MGGAGAGSAIGGHSELWLSELYSRREVGCGLGGGKEGGRRGV